MSTPQNNNNRLESVDPVDSYVGNRLRERRTFRGLSQDKLAQKEGITFQQVQKYEKGINRLSMSRLVHFALILNTPPSWFLEGLPLTGMLVQDDYANGISQHEIYELVRLYSKISTQRQRTAFLDMMKVYIKDVCQT